MSRGQLNKRYFDVKKLSFYIITDNHTVQSSKFVDGLLNQIAKEFHLKINRVFFAKFLEEDLEEGCRQIKRQKMPLTRQYVIAEILFQHSALKIKLAFHRTEVARQKQFLAELRRKVLTF